MSLQSEMQEYIDKNCYISVERDYIEDMGMYCFPCKICGDVVVVRFTGDFEYNGFRVISFDDISGIEYGETEEFYEKIHRENAAIDAELPDFGNAEGFGGVLEVLMNLGINAAVECELSDDDGYYMGKITAVDDQTVTMKCFDGCARWLDDECTVDLDSITMVTFGDRYLRVLSQYAE